MSLEPQELTIPTFKAAVGSFASSVTVISVRDAHRRPLGMTATAFCSVSTDPFLVLVCINRSTRTHSDVLSGGSFGVNLLEGNGVEVSAYCSRPGTDKLLPSEWLVDGGARWSAPALRHSLAFLDCEVYRHFPAGTHGVIIGKVCAVGLSETSDEGITDPLIHFRGQYRRLVAPALTAP